MFFTWARMRISKVVVDVSDLDRLWGTRARHERFLGEAATITDAYLLAHGDGQDFPARLKNGRNRHNVFRAICQIHLVWAVAI